MLVETAQKRISSLILPPPSLKLHGQPMLDFSQMSDEDMDYNEEIITNFYLENPNQKEIILEKIIP